MSKSTKPEALTSFLEGMPKSIERALNVLSAAVSLTDEIAVLLIDTCAPAEYPSQAIVDALHLTDFIIERNSEWEIRENVRLHLLRQLHAERRLAESAHRLLLDAAHHADRGAAGNTVPTYFTWPVADAYHSAIHDPERALASYARAYTGKFTGEQWLLGKAAEEQQNEGILPPEALEPAFLQGMAAYREGRRNVAERYLSHVADSDADRIEVAIALHVLAVMRKKKGNFLQIVRMLRRSLAIGEKVGDLYTQAQVLHTLGDVLSREDPKEAEDLLDRSLSIGVELGNARHQAQVLHTLGALVARHDPVRAEQLLRDSLALGEQTGNFRHQAQVLNTLGSLVVQRDFKAGEEFLQNGAKIGEIVNDPLTVGWIRSTLGNLYRNRGHWLKSKAEYEGILRISNHPKSVSIAHEGLSIIAEEHDRDIGAAISHLREAIAVQQGTGSPRHLRRLEQRLARLQRR